MEKMVVSRREGSISSNIRAIIEQLNLNPVERRRLIDRTKQDAGAPRCMGMEPAARISIGVYGCKERGGGGYEMMAVRRAPDRPRPRQETGQRKILAPKIKREGEGHALEVIEKLNLDSQTRRFFFFFSFSPIRSGSSSFLFYFSYCVRIQFFRYYGRL